MKKGSLYLYNIVPNTKVLGANSRFAIWVQGCDKRCSFCLVPDSWSKTSGGYEMTIDELVKKVCETKGISGLTISGGEPFLQSLELVHFIDELNSKRKGLDYIVYTGYQYEEIIENEEQKQLLESIDLLIDGEYIDELNDDTPLVGSSNQGVYILSDRGEKLAFEMSNKKAREIEFVVKTTDNIFTVGIPPKNMNERLKGAL
jgi:anaerobic ribonucleoside-triphosphate reductase activating protein